MEDILNPRGRLDQLQISASGAVVSGNRCASCMGGLLEKFAKQKRTRSISASQLFDRLAGRDMITRSRISAYILSRTKCKVNS